MIVVFITRGGCFMKEIRFNHSLYKAATLSCSNNTKNCDYIWYLHIL